VSVAPLDQEWRLLRATLRRLPPRERAATIRVLSVMLRSIRRQLVEHGRFQTRPPDRRATRRSP